MRILQGDSPVNMHGNIGGDSCGGFAFTSAVENVTIGEFLETTVYCETSAFSARI
jgi:hypothetical protein